MYFACGENFDFILFLDTFKDSQTECNIRIRYHDLFLNQTKLRLFHNINSPKLIICQMFLSNLYFESLRLG